MELKLSIEHSCFEPRTFHEYKCFTVSSSYVFLLKQDDKGKFNFDETAVRNPETGELVSWLPCHPVHYWIHLCFTLFMNLALPITVIKWTFRLSDLELVQGQ